MKLSTKKRILKKLDNAKRLTDEAFCLLDEEDKDKCDHFASVGCELDEAIGEVDTLNAATTDLSLQQMRGD